MTLLHSEIRRRKSNAKTFLWLGIAGVVIGFFVLVGAVGAGAFWTSTVVFGNTEAAQKAVDSMTGPALAGSLFLGAGGVMLAIGWQRFARLQIDQAKNSEAMRLSKQTMGLHVAIGVLALNSGVGKAASNAYLVEVSLAPVNVPIGIAGCILGLVFICTGLAVGMSVRGF